jgi:hypothetical protein
MILELLTTILGKRESEVCDDCTVVKRALVAWAVITSNLKCAAEVAMEYAT